MAKLNVVIPAADVEVIGKDGARTKYRKVERKAEKGDVIKITDSDDSSYVIEGAFHTVEYLDGADDPQILDEVGDEYDAGHMKYEVYEKVAVAVATQQYREVKRPAKVGERIKIVNAQLTGGDYGNWDEMIVTEAKWAATHAVNADFDGETVHIWYDEYVVLEPVESAQPAQPKRLTVGDYAKVIASGNQHNYEVGSVVKIVVDDMSGVPYRGEKPDGSEGNWLKESQVAPATEAEFLAQKPLKVGDYVKVTDASGDGDAEVGDIAEVVSVEAGLFSYDPLLAVKTVDGREVRMFAKRFVRATEAEVESAKQALKYGDFADGDYAQIVRATNDNASPDAIRNAGKAVTVTREIGPSKVRGLRLRLPNGELAGFANADALRKVTREEYEAAVDPRNKFAKGDKVRLVSGGGTPGLFDYETGGIYTVSDPKYFTGEIEITGGGQRTAYATPEQLEKVSDEELAEIERWAAIGRKVGEFKRGDIVKITSTDKYDGVVGEVEDVGETLLGVVESGGSYRAPHQRDATLIVPVEQRFDQAEAAA
ncbi:hypothetical protein [uncultured Paenibacillus sp.]|uniref:hypothetical protein n=1 Tax=uncultured Paenibacillus sp. TaxID=227322 RepID=UPI0015A8D538|nr:hypothetical protein [uncultured Paenibacillus sp.]